jgi:hypothetical protein
LQCKLDGRPTENGVEQRNVNSCRGTKIQDCPFT